MSDGSDEDFDIVRNGIGEIHFKRGETGGRGERGEGRGGREKKVNRVGWGGGSESILNSWYVWVACRGTAADSGGCGPLLFTKRGTPCLM